MRPVAANLVDLDDDYARHKGGEGDKVKRRVDKLSGAFLVRRLGRLEDENGVDEGEDGDGHGDGVA